jgi:putative membrane-bound dehydrogenase-like protein
MKLNKTNSLCRRLGGVPKLLASFATEFVSGQFLRGAVWAAVVLLASSLATEATADETTPKPPNKNAVQVIEGFRGGRHWVNSRTAPPKSPEESLKTIKTEPGIKIELFAAEPLVRDPVAIAFDDRGRMFVVEYGDYPIGPEKGGDPLSRVVYLEDTNHDGRADKRHVFADKLTFAHSLMAYKGGFLVGAQTQILFLKDTDDDHVADVRKVLFDGFTPAHPQMQIGNPRWGLDNWVHLNYGPGKITSSKNPGAAVAMPRKDFRFNPLTDEFEADSGLGQFGNTIDRWGHRFYCTNRNPIMTTLLSPATIKRNRFFTPAQAHYDVGKAGGDTRVYPLIEMKSNYLSHAGTHTSACGVTAYTGGGSGMPAGFHNSSVFVCEPIGHLVTRSIVHEDGLRLKVTRAREKADFIASTDTWFRPASLVNAPDGSMYLADMYRLWVEHPKFLPAEIAAKLDWRAGEDRGRIYRISRGQKTKPFKQPQSIDDKVKLLASSHGWQQYLGQRLIIEKQDKTAAPLLRKLMADSPRATSRLHALWTLDGLGMLTPPDVYAALKDSDHHVRRDGVKLSRRWIKTDDEIFKMFANLLADRSIHVRFEVALTLGETDRPGSTEMLVRLALMDGHNEWFAKGLLTSVGTRAGSLLGRIFGSRSEQRTPDSTGELTPYLYMAKQLAAIVGARGNIDELRSLLAVVTRPIPAVPLAEQVSDIKWWRVAVISGLGEGLPRHRGDLGSTSLPKLVANPPPELKDAVAQLRKLLAESQVAALDKDMPNANRIAAVELLAYMPFAKASDSFDQLLSNVQPVALQLAAINGLSANGSKDAAAIVLKHWPELGPTVRGPALAVLLRRTISIRQMLKAMSQGQMKSSALSIDQRVRLLKNRDDSIRNLATKLFGGAVSTNRREVAKKYEAALELKGSFTAGRDVFKKTCAKCHRLDGEGHEAGPDLSDVRNRSRLALLYDVMDPNAKVEPRFTAYSVTTNDGKIYNGLIISETPEAVVLRMAEGKQQVIGRNQIESLRAGNVSLMPEGIEKDVSVQQMADLLQYLKTRKP